MDTKPLVGKSSLVLIIDRENFLGSRLAYLLGNHATTVLVAKEHAVGESNAILVPHVHPAPKIPEGVYSRVVIVWNEEDKHMIEPVIKKATEWQANVFVVFLEEDEKALEYANQFDATILVLGDLFGGPTKQPLDDFLESAKVIKRIKLSGMGLNAWYPVLYADAIRKIAEVVISPSLKGKSFLVGPAHQMTALSIAHFLQKIDPEILTDFSGTEDHRPEKRFVSVFDAYNATEKLRAYFKALRISYKKKIEKPAPIVFSKKQPSGKKRGMGLYVLYVVLVFLLLPVVLIMGSGGLGLLFLSAGMQDAEHGQLIGARQKADAAVIAFGVSQSSIDMMSQVNAATIRSPLIEQFHRQVTVGSQLADAADALFIASEKLSGVLRGKSLDGKGDVGSAVSGFKHASLVLSGIADQDVPLSYRSLIAQAKAVSNLSSSIFDVLPQIIGVGSDKKYLVLFQNNMELRPGGGFIGSYGLLSLHNGAVSNFTIHDVYDADGQLKGHVEPPFAIRRYIPIVHLYLRDSNFDPDFSANAQTAAYMLSQETGDRVDGVVGIDLDVLKGVLASVGSVYVPSYSQTVNEANFFQLLEEHAEKNFFPGSTQKKDFLNAFAAALMGRLQQGISGRILFEKFITLLAEKHIVFGFGDPSVQAPFSLAGLSSTLVDTRASESAAFNDFLGFVEANIGIDKTNAFVSRKVAQQVTLQENGDVQETVSLTLTNDSNGDWPGGPYKNYIRFMLPQNAQLLSISFDGVEQNVVNAVTDPKIYEAKSFVAPKGLEVAKDTEAGKTLYGFLVTVAPKAEREIVLSYRMPHAYAVDSLEQRYSLLLWKQVGINPYPYQLQVSIPPSFRLLSATPKLLQHDQMFEYDGLVSGDAVFTLAVAKK